MKWEYTTLSIKVSHSAGLGAGIGNAVISDDDELEFKKFGEQGWELVAVMPADDATLVGSSGTRSGVAFFKRPKDGS